MRNLRQKKYLLGFLIFIVLTMFFRTDFRFKNTIECCSDDYDYYVHAETIALDFDLDYSNQNIRSWNYNLYGKSTPIGFIGSGILSAPFLFIGNLISTVTNENDKNIYNFTVLFYSLSSIFYLFLSYIFIYKTSRILKSNLSKYLILLIFAGSGVAYFAFERFSMTHAYEVFTTSLIIFLTCKYCVDNKSRSYAFLIPFALNLALLVRLSNYYVLLVPLITRLLIKEKIDLDSKLKFKKEFLLSTFTNLIIYYYISLQLYGKLIFDPRKIYGSNISISENLVSNNNIFETLSTLVKTGFTIVFGLEFGLLWCSPILFIGLFYILKNLKSLSYLLVLLCFGQLFYIVHMWQSTGSSYGFRYLYSLIPIGFLLLFTNYKDNSIERSYLILFSVFSILCLLFFETTELTQLSIEKEINSFGKNTRYVEPFYVKGVVASLIEINSYLIIFSTSLLGALFFKISLIIFGIKGLVELLEKLSLPTNNSDFQQLLSKLDQIPLINLSITALFLFTLSFYIVFYLKEKSDI
jgi:hypothetical protein